MKIQTPRKPKPKPKRKPVKPADIPYQKTLAQILPTSKKKPGSTKGMTYASRDPVQRKADEKAERDAKYEAWADRVISGEKILQVGSTGKEFWAAAPIAIQQRVWESHHNKVRPTLTATAVKAQIQTEDITSEDAPDDRELARMISAMVYESQLGRTEEPKAIAAPIPDYSNTPSWETEPEAGEVREPSGLADLPRRKTPDKPMHGDRYDCANGSHVRYYEGPNNTQGRWHVLDKNNIHHATNYTFDKSIKLAQGLPEPTAAFQIDPFSVQQNMNMQAENLDRRKEAMPLGPPSSIRNIQREPRPAWKPRRGQR